MYLAFKRYCKPTPGTEQCSCVRVCLCVCVYVCSGVVCTEWKSGDVKVKATERGLQEEGITSII